MADFAVDGPLAKEAQEASPDNVASFSDARNEQRVSKIKGAIQNMPYTMNLPYEIGQNLNSEGKLPLPIGTPLLPRGGQGYADEVHKIIGYKGDMFSISSLIRDMKCEHQMVRFSVKLLATEHLD
jgi:hypothetical protein